ncbi:MAG: hypothetical protein ABEJ72_03085, partial [Candidatus Aenigmatarchaeota archaeon]
MVTANFKKSFIKKKVDSEDDLDLVENEEGITVMSGDTDFTGSYRLKNIVEEVGSVFDFSVDEAIKFDKQFEDFGGRKDYTDRMKETARRFQNSYREEKISELSDMLRAENKRTSLGHDIWNFLKGPEADILAEDAEDEIDEILNTSKEDNIDSQIDDILEGKYREAAREVYSEFKDDIGKVVGLEDITGQDTSMDSFDVFTWLKGKQENPYWDQEIDTNQVSERLESEIDTRVRQRTLEALDTKAETLVAEKYEEITGEK